MFFIFITFFHVSKQNSPRFAESHLGLLSLPVSHKKEARLIWVKNGNPCIRDPQFESAYIFSCSCFHIHAKIVLVLRN